MRKKIPGPRALPFIGVAHHYLKNPLGYVEKLRNEFGDIVAMPLPGANSYLINDPDFIKEIFTQTNKVFVKTKKTGKMIERMLGPGLLSATGEVWKRQRSTLNPAFLMSSIRGFEKLFQTEIETLLKSWAQKKDVNNGVIEISSEMAELTLGIVISSMFSTDVHSQAKDISWITSVLQGRFMSLMRRPIFLPDLLPTKAVRDTRKAKKLADKIMYGLIHERRKNPGVARHDLLSTMLTGLEQGDGTTEEEIRNQMLTLFLAGHDTTSNALTFTFYLLAKNPTVMAKLVAEVDSVLQGRPATMDDLENLSYTRMVFEETLRLYPPAYFMMRSLDTDYTYQDYHFNKGDVVFLSMWSMHRDPRFWDNPLEFKPERFSAENKKDRHRYVYFPFGGGPRVCIGQNLAIIEAQMIISMIVQKYALEYVPDQKFDLRCRVTLSADPGIKLRLVPR
jgi:cytochrome P450